MTPGLLERLDADGTPVAYFATSVTFHNLFKIKNCFCGLEILLITFLPEDALVTMRNFIICTRCCGSSPVLQTGFKDVVD